MPFKIDDEVVVSEANGPVGLRGRTGVIESVFGDPDAPYSYEVSIDGLGTALIIHPDALEGVRSA